MRFNLIVNYHTPKNAGRKKEYIQCIKNNLDNDLIKKVILFCEEKETLPFENEKIEYHQIKHNHRPSFSEMFEYANKNLYGEDCIISNTDIYFDESLKKMDDFPLENHFICSPDGIAKRMDRQP